MKLFHFLLVSCLLLGCTKESDSNDREYVTTCYRFIEYTTNEPVAGLNILLHYGYEGILSSQGITDSDGTWCFEHWNDEGLSATPYHTYDNLYYNFPSTLPLNGKLNTIQLTPWSKIRFHVMNIEPANETDRLYLSNSYDIDGVGYGVGRSFVGSDIDAIYYAKAAIGINEITKSVYSSDVQIGWSRYEVRIHRWGDTIHYNIEY